MVGEIGGSIDETEILQRQIRDRNLRIGSGGRDSSRSLRQRQGIRESHEHQGIMRQNDIAERLTLATREYNDSLEKVYCGTGQKFLNFYNDEVEIPLLQE